MIFIQAARASGKTTNLIAAANEDPNSILVVPSPNRLSYLKARHPNIKHIVTCEYLLNSLRGERPYLDFRDKGTDFNLYFEEPSLYWDIFLRIIWQFTILGKDKQLHMCSYTPKTIEQTDLLFIPPKVVTGIQTVSWRYNETLHNC